MVNVNKLKAKTVENSTVAENVGRSAADSSPFGECDAIYSPESRSIVSFIARITNWFMLSRRRSVCLFITTFGLLVHGSGYL